MCEIYCAIKRLEEEKEKEEDSNSEYGKSREFILISKEKENIKFFFKYLPKSLI